MVLLAQTIGAIYGLLAIIFGAFGAHLLKIQPESRNIFGEKYDLLFYSWHFSFLFQYLWPFY